MASGGKGICSVRPLTVRRVVDFDILRKIGYVALTERRLVDFHLLRSEICCIGPFIERSCVDHGPLQRGDNKESHSRVIYSIWNLTVR